MRKSRMLLMLFVLLFPVALFSQGCLLVGPGPGATTGDMEVSWTFDGLAACPGNVRDVRIIINGGQDTVLEACTAGGRRLRDFVPNDYGVRVQGLDFDGTVTWDSGEQTIPVYAGNIADARFNLSE